MNKTCEVILLGSAWKPGQTVFLNGNLVPIRTI